MDLLDILKDKQSVLNFLVQTMETNARAASGLRDKCHQYSDGAKIHKLMEVVSNQAIQLEKLSAILLVYVSSSNFDADVAKKLMEMGRGNEALKQMFKNKMDGK